MASKQPVRADGKVGASRPDGVSDPVGDGESQGGAYPNPHSGEEHPDFDGGQSGKSYEGPDNPNATTRED